MSPRRTPPRPKINEADLQANVVDLAHLLGWTVAHFRSARRRSEDGYARWETPVQYDGAGFPDLVLARDRVIFAELKGDRGRVDPKQEAWLDKLRVAGAEVYLWYPEDWLTGTIEAVLTRSDRQ